MACAQVKESLFEAEGPGKEAADELLKNVNYTKIAPSTEALFAQLRCLRSLNNDGLGVVIDINLVKKADRMVDLGKKTVVVTFGLHSCSKLEGLSTKALQSATADDVKKKLKSKGVELPTCMLQVLDRYISAAVTPQSITKDSKEAKQQRITEDSEEAKQQEVGADAATSAQVAGTSAASAETPAVIASTQKQPVAAAFAPGARAQRARTRARPEECLTSDAGVSPHASMMGHLHVGKFLDRLRAV